MRFLKKILAVLLVLICLAFIIALFVDDQFAVKREITINKNNKEVFDYIKLLKNQNNFSIWAKKDPKMKKTFKGIDGTVGFVSAWESKNDEVGKGEQEITKIIDGKRIEFDLRFKEPMKAENTAYMETTALSPTKTKVTWGFNGKMNYPMNIMLLFMDFDEMVGKDFEEGLENLKVLLEK